MLDNKRTSNVDITTLAATLVLKAGSTHRDEGVEAEVFRVDDIAETSRSGHAAWVAVDDLHDTEVRIVEVNGQGDRLARRVLIDVVRVTTSTRNGWGRTRETANNFAESNVGNEGQAVHLTILGED